MKLYKSTCTHCHKKFLHNKKMWVKTKEYRPDYVLNYMLGIDEDEIYNIYAVYCPHCHQLNKIIKIKPSIKISIAIFISSIITFICMAIFTW